MRITSGAESLAAAALVLAGLGAVGPARGEYMSTNYNKYNGGKLGHRPHLEFHSSTEYAPVLQVNTWNESAISRTGSHIFLRHDGNESSPLSTPLVLDARDLSAVFMNRSFENVFGTRVQADRGRKYLTFWEGQKGDGIGNGWGLAYDDSYRLAYNVSAQGIGHHSDLHEFAFTGHGTALVTGVQSVKADTATWRAWRGPKQYQILDALFQEIDLDTNEVLFSWRALDHLDPVDSFEHLALNWDAFHMNSIEKTQAGNYLISIRHTHSIHLVDGQTGAIIWTLGGHNNDFTELAPAPGANPQAPLLSFGWQHHARFVPGTHEREMTFFDNHVKTTTHGQCGSTCSRGLHIALDTSASPPTARLLREYRHPARLQAQSQGSVQPLGSSSGSDDNNNNNVFIGWGRCPSFTEHGPDGEAVMDVQFSPWHSAAIPDALDNYRAYKMDWTAAPWWAPALALRESPDGDLDVYASWNGATEVREWVVRGETDAADSTNSGASAPALELARSARTGFETKLTVARMPGARRLWAEALGRNGEVLRATEVVDLGDGGSGGVGNVTMIVDEDDDWDSDNPVVLRHSAVSLSTWLAAGGGLVGAVLAVVAGCVVWRRRGGGRDYDELDDGSDVESEADTIDIDDAVFGLDFDRVPEPWEEFNTPWKGKERGRQTV